MTTVAIPQPPIIRKEVFTPQPHIDGEYTENIREDHGDHFHNRTIRHIDVHQPGPQIRDVVVPQPPILTRVPITNETTIRVPRAIYRNELKEVERVDMRRETVEVPVTTTMPKEEMEEYEEIEEHVVRVPVKKYRKVIRDVDVKTTHLIEHDVPVVTKSFEPTQVPDIVYEDQILRTTTH